MIIITIFQEPIKIGYFLQSTIGSNQTVDLKPGNDLGLCCGLYCDLGPLCPRRSSLALMSCRSRKLLVSILLVHSIVCSAWITMNLSHILYVIRNSCEQIAQPIPKWFCLYHIFNKSGVYYSFKKHMEIVRLCIFYIDKL